MTAEPEHLACNQHPRLSPDPNRDRDHNPLPETEAAGRSFPHIPTLSLRGRGLKGEGETPARGDGP